VLTRFYLVTFQLTICIALFLQLPRPEWAKRKNVLLKTLPGLWLTRFLAWWNCVLIVREIWYRFCHPGTFRAILRAAWVSVTTGERFQWPSTEDALARSGKQDASQTSAVLPDSLRWYVSTADLHDFRDVIEHDSGPAWEFMLQKEFDGCSYTAWRRSLPSGKTEYKSVTLSEDATAQEFMDFYLDDDVRPKWDGMISEHQLLESAHDTKNRCQVVRWLRSFPFAFLSRREYVIARRLFPGDDPNTLYGITKSVEHPAAPPLQGIVRMSTFYSMWRSRTLPCPRGSGKPMCETTLLHFEDFGIPENLARFAVRHGMAGFVGKMVPEVKEFVKERRARCDPYQQDSQAYGAGLTPLMRSGSGSSLPGTPKGGASGGSPAALGDGVAAAPAAASGSGGMLRSSSVRGFGYMLLASGVALALARTSSNPCLVGNVSSSPAGSGRKKEEEEAATASVRSSLDGGRHANGVRRAPFAQQLHKHLHHAKKHHRTHGGASKHHGHHGHHAAALKQRPHAVAGLRSHRVSHAEADA
jgi:hypothetical protein